jgi:hypothetical protein
MMNNEREQIEALARKSVNLRDLWLRERQEAITDQLAANAEVKKRWEASDPVEVNQNNAVNGKRSR